MGWLSAFRSFGPWGLCLIMLVFLAAYRGEANKAKADLRASRAEVERVTKVANDNAAVVKRLQAERVAQQAESDQLQAELKASRNRRVATSAAVRKAGTTNAKARDYLGTRIPDDLRRVLESDR